ncbi:hypothetical protein [Phocaeicola sp.]|jgi:hypothetical protein|uniref:hypothetical protein n=1 Tax=Phocaeicola sp. TaxID=2773926 RepID=UPI0040270B40
MSDLNLENIVGFKAVDKDGNEQNVTVDEMVDMVSTRMVMALSETSTFAAAAATGNDVYENELPTVTDAANVRVLQSSGDAAKMTMQSLASKLGELLPLSTNTNKGLTRRTAYFDLIQGKLYKIAYKEELHVYKPVICLLYVLRSGISSCYVASLSGYRNGVSHFKLICGNDIQFKLYQKLNSANYFDFMLECPDNSAGIMEIKAMIDLTVIETTEPLSDWQQIATK